MTSFPEFFVPHHEVLSPVLLPQVEQAQAVFGQFAVAFHVGLAVFFHEFLGGFFQVCNQGQAGLFQVFPHQLGAQVLFGQVAEKVQVAPQVPHDFVCLDGDLELVGV